MDGWTDDQKRQADEKVRILNQEAAAGGLRVTRNSERSGAGRSWAQDCERPENCDADHMIDLQLGGRDQDDNFWWLDRSVNRSLGPQIWHQICAYPDGTMVIGVDIT